MKADELGGAERTDGTPPAMFSDLESLLGALPPGDIISRSCPQVELGSSASGGRFPEEQLNVQVDAYLWHVRKETANDYYQLILGSTADENGRNAAESPPDWIAVLQRHHQPVLRLAAPAEVTQ